MGLSSSKQKTRTAQQQQSTTMPVMPDWVTQPLQQLAGRTSSFLSGDPSRFVAPASPLQEQAFSAGASLGGWRPAMNQALDLARSSAAASPGSVSFEKYKAPRISGPAMVDQVGIAPAAHANAESLLTGLNDYIDPYLGRVVDTTLANYDRETGKQAAQLAATGARNGAFGGSRFGLAEGEFGALSGMNRAATEAGLRSNAFTTAGQLSADDANRRQNAHAFNAGADNMRGLTQAQLDMERLAANVAARNSFALAQGQMDEAAARHEADAKNQAAQLNSQLAEARMQRALQAAGLGAEIGNATAANERADVGLAADLGALAREIEKAKLNAEPTQLQLAGALLGGLPYPAIVGQEADSSMTGTSTTKTSPGLGSIAGGLLGSALSGWAGGGFSFG